MIGRALRNLATRVDIFLYFDFVESITRYNIEWRDRNRWEKGGGGGGGGEERENAVQYECQQQIALDRSLYPRPVVQVVDVAMRILGSSRANGGDAKDKRAKTPSADLAGLQTLASKGRFVLQPSTADPSRGTGRHFKRVVLKGSGQSAIESYEQTREGLHASFAGFPMGFILALRWRRLG